MEVYIRGCLHIGGTKMHSLEQYYLIKLWFIRWVYIEELLVRRFSQYGSK